MIEYFILGAFGVVIGVFIGFILCRRFCIIPAHRPQPQLPPQQPPQLTPHPQFHQPLPMPPAPPAPTPEPESVFQPLENLFKKRPEPQAPKAEVVDTDKQEVKYTTKGQPYVIQPDGKAKFIKKSEVG